MKSFHEYWSFTAMRGIFALLAAISIVAIPRAISSFFELPILLGFAIGLFALYTFFDLAATALLDSLLPDAAGGRRNYLQFAFIALVTVLLFLTGYHVLSLGWLVWLAAAQAAVTALAEFLIARSTHREYGCLSCYSTAIVLAVSAIALPFTGRLDSTGIALALASYLGLLGLSELTLGSRMLFTEYRGGNPAPQFLDQTWRALMTAQLSTQPVAMITRAARAAACAPELTCDTCPVDLVCLDNSLGSQLTAILTTRQPSIVSSIRATALVQSHQ